MHEMKRKFISIVMIIFIAIPPTFFMKPHKADAFLFLLARPAATAAISVISRQAISLGARMGIGKYRNMTQLVLPLRPQRGRLYNLVVKNWTPFKKILAGNSLAYALAFFLMQNRTDKTITGCTDWRVIVEGRANVVQAGSASSAFTAGMSQNGLIANISLYTLAPTSSFYSSVLKVYADGTSVNKGSVTCLVRGSQDKSALTNYVELDLLPFSDAQNEPKLDKLFNDIQSKAASDKTFTIPDSSTSTEGLSLQEVQSQTFETLNPDGTKTTHTITKDPVTGELVIDGVAQGDYAEITDINGITHKYTIDAVTGNILDNGVPIGNFASWTDADGVAHLVTTDPVTGALLMDGKPWNDFSSPPSPSLTTPPTTTIDPYTGLITQTGSGIDIQPLIDAQGRAIVEQKKTTDELLKTNKSLKDLYSSTQANNNELKKSNKNLNDIYSALTTNSGATATQAQVDAIRVAESATNYVGVTSFMNRVGSSPIANSLGSALIVTGATGYPAWSISKSLTIVGQTYMLDASLDTANYANFFAMCSSVIMLGAAWFAFRRIFG